MKKNSTNYIYNIKGLFVLCAVAFLSAHIVNAQDISSGLEAYFPFDCSPEDATGNGHDGTLIGGPVCEDGKLGEAYNLNGSGDYIQLPSANSAKLISNTGFSWALWFKGSAVPTETDDGHGQTMISVANESLRSDVLLGFGASYTPKNVLVFEVNGPGGVGGAMPKPCTYEEPGGFENDKWYHVAGVRDYDNDLVILYFNGAAVDTVTFGGDPFDNDMYATIGAFIDGNFTTAFFNGTIDEVRFYNRPLSGVEVGMLFSLNPDQLEINSNDLDFGTLLCGNDSTQSVQLINTGPSVFTVTATDFIIGQNFSVANGGIFTLADQEVYELEIRFIPTSDGDFGDTLIINNGIGITPLQVYVHGSKDSLTYSLSTQPAGNEIDFGLICPSASKDTSFILNLTFNEDSKFTGRIDDPFAFVDSTLGQSSGPIAANSSKEIPIRFAGNPADGLYSGELTVIDECGNERVIQLKAEVYTPAFGVEANADTAVCPTAIITKQIEIFNKGTKDQSFIINSNNPDFVFPEAVTISAGSSELVSFDFNSPQQGGLHSADIIIDAGCRLDTTIRITMDVTDIQIEATNTDMDFGEVVLCNPDTSITRTFSITNGNISGRPLVVANIELTNPAYSTSLAIGEDFELSAAKTFDLTFDPNGTGDYSGQMIITFDTCDVTRIYSLNAIATELIVQYNQAIDFGKVVNDEVRDSMFTFYNSGTSSLDITEITHPGTPFELLSSVPAIPATLDTGDSIVVRFRYTALGGLRTSTITLVASTPCGDENYQIALSGEGSFLARVTLTVPGEIVASPGDVINIPITLSEAIDLDSAKVTGYWVDIKVNPTLLSPVAPTPAGVLIDNKLVVNVNLPVETGAPGQILAEFPFKVALGNAASDSIIIENAVPTGGLSQIDFDNGIISMAGLCQEGGTRLFEAEQNLELMQSRPNPSGNSVEIEFEVIEKGPTKIYILDMNGAKVMTVLDRVLKPGRHIINADVSGLPAASYVYILRTPTQLVSRKLQVIK